MKIKLHGLGKGVTELSQTIDPAELNLSQDNFKLPVAVKLWLEDVGDVINADFSISTVSEQSCSRYLEIFEENLNLKGRLLFIPEFGHKYADSEDVITFNPDRPEVDISQNLLDELMLALPFIPLCNEDCKGLCANCGTNLNEEQCNCKVEYIDPRWSALADLKDKLAEKKSTIDSLNL